MFSAYDNVPLKGTGSICKHLIIEGLINVFRAKQQCMNVYIIILSR